MKVTKPELEANIRVLWLINSLGYESLLYWGDILSAYLERLPQSEFYATSYGRKNIPNTDSYVEKIWSLKINLGKRSNSYGWFFNIVTPFILRKFWTFRPSVCVIQEFSLLSLYVVLFGRLLRRSCKILLLVESDPIRGRKNRYGKFRIGLRKLIAKRADLILTNNEGGKRFLTDVLKVNASKVVVRVFLASQPPKAIEGETPEHLPPCIQESSQDEINFLFVGQLTERKGVLKLIEAIEAIPIEQRRRARFWMAGSGELESKIESLINEKNLSDQVSLLGRIDFGDLGAVYRCADVLIMPTLDDYRSLVSFEALHHSLPLLASIHDGAHIEAVIPGVNGMSFDPLDIKSTTDGILWFLHNIEQIPAMKKASKMHASNFTVDIAVENLVSTVGDCSNS
jgi:glycosyltransferase involved in cell wall biosynthesis